MTAQTFFSYPPAQYHAHRAEILTAVERVLERGPYVLGPEVEAFEAEFASWHNGGSTVGVGVGSGTDALIFALQAFDIGPGDEVITVSHTALATVAAILQTGATPVLVDIEAETYTLDPDQLATALSPKTRAIIPVHLYGQPCDMDAILTFAQQHNLVVIEDCAQAQGALYKGQRVGTLGDAGCFSFYPTKNLGAIGDGGAVLTASTDVAARIKRLRQYGWDDNRLAREVARVSRLDEIQAAILRVKLAHLEADIGKRQALADQYMAGLAGHEVKVPTVRPDCRHGWHLYVISTPTRDALQAQLAAQNIMAGIHYPQAVHQHTAYVDKVRIPIPLTVTESLLPTLLSLPLYPELPAEKIMEITGHITPAHHRASM